MNKFQVSFLCTGNSDRSQLAEAFLRHYRRTIFDAYSAGFEPQGINPYTERVMDEVGISMEGQRSKNLAEYLGKKHFSYLITACSDAEKKWFSTYHRVRERLS